MTTGTDKYEGIPEDMKRRLRGERTDHDRAIVTDAEQAISVLDDLLALMPFERISIALASDDSVSIWCGSDPHEVSANADTVTAALLALRAQLPKEAV